MAAPAVPHPGPPPPDDLYFIPQIPDLHGLDAFEPAIPQPLPNLPAPIQNVETLDGYDFFHFLGALNNINMWERDPTTDKVLNVSAAGRKVFLSMGKIVAGIHRNGQFAGDLIRRIRIYEDRSVNFPFPNMNPDEETDLYGGILTDLIHFRWMVAKVIVTSVPNYHQMLSDTFKLFFSQIYIDYADKYWIFQLLHPIFFDASDRMNFLQLILDYEKENPKAKNGFQHLRHYNYFQQWWSWKDNFPEWSWHIFKRVYEHNENDRLIYRRQISTLPRFIRNMHHHYAQRNRMGPTHEKIDSLLHRAFPGVCEVIVDGQIRSFHRDWQCIPPRYPNPCCKFYRSLAQYFITKPYPFTVEPYRYQY